MPSTREGKLSGGEGMLEGTMLVKNAQVFGPEPMGIQDLLVVAGKIVLIGKGLEKPPWVKEVLDGEGRPLVPGSLTSTCTSLAVAVKRVRLPASLR